MSTNICYNKKHVINNDIYKITDLSREVFFNILSCLPYIDIINRVMMTNKSFKNYVEYYEAVLDKININMRGLRLFYETHPKKARLIINKVKNNECVLCVFNDDANKFRCSICKNFGICVYHCQCQMSMCYNIVCMHHSPCGNMGICKKQCRHCNKCNEQYCIKCINMCMMCGTYLCLNCIRIGIPLC